MAKIPAYFAKVQPGTSRLPRAPVGQLADTGQGIEAQAIAQAGQALTDTSAVLAKWYEREGNSQFDTSRANVQDMLTGFENFPFPDADSHKAGYKKLLTAIEKEAPGNKSGAAKFKSWTKLNRTEFDKLSNEKMIRMIAKQNQISLFENLDSISKITDRKKAKAEIKLLVQGGLDDGSIKTAAQAIALQEKATNEWLEVDLERRATATIRPDDEVDFSEAVKYLAKAENIKGIPSDVTTELLRKLQAQETAQRRRDAEKLETLQEETGRQRITDLWDNLLTDPQIITDDLRNGRISLVNAKFLRNAMLNPEPPKTDLLAYADGLRAKNDVGRGAKTVNQALDVVYGNVEKLDPATGKSLVKDIFGEHDKHDADMEKEGRDLMEELIREKTPLGIFTDDELQIITTAEALVELNASIKAAIKRGKPLVGKELLIEAIRIGRLKKRELNEKIAKPGKEPAKVPEFLYTNPSFYGELLKGIAELSEGERAKILEDEKTESKARTKIYDMWESFSLLTKDKIIQGYKLGKPLTEIMKDKDVEAEIKQALEGPKMPSPQTTREYDLLPSGTRYLHYKGDIRIKK